MLFWQTKKPFFLKRHVIYHTQNNQKQILSINKHKKVIYLPFIMEKNILICLLFSSRIFEFLYWKNNKKQSSRVYAQLLWINARSILSFLFYKIFFLQSKKKEVFMNIQRHGRKKNILFTDSRKRISFLLKDCKRFKETWLQF